VSWQGYSFGKSRRLRRFRPRFVRPWGQISLDWRVWPREASLQCRRCVVEPLRCGASIPPVMMATPGSFHGRGRDRPHRHSCAGLRRVARRGWWLSCCMNHADGGGAARFSTACPDNPSFPRQRNRDTLGRVASAEACAGAQNAGAGQGGKNSESYGQNRSCRRLPDPVARCL